MYNLDQKDYAFLKTLNTPGKIQDYLDSIPFNFEDTGETCMSPTRVLKEKKAHCMEGAMLAALALHLSGHKMFLLSLKVDKNDFDHAVALFRMNGYWGAISKTNHAVLRYRDPVYATVRELAMSYFHEYFLVEDGKKTMKGFSNIINLRRYGTKWITSMEDLWHISSDIFHGYHHLVVPEKNLPYIRKASNLEKESASIPEWKDR